MGIFNVVDRTLLPPQHNYFNDLRRSYREGGAVKNETLGNLSHLPDELVEIIRAALQGTTSVPHNEAFEVIRSRSQGTVEAVALTMQRLGFATLIASKPCRERDIVLAIVAARIVAPHTKLATTRWWHTTTLAEDFEVADASEDELYAAGLAAASANPRSRTNSPANICNLAMERVKDAFA